MSSYQFVNSLAASSCYGRGTAAAAASAAGADLSGMSAADYYATAMGSYQQNCYPQQPQQQQQHYGDYQQQQQQQHAMPMSPAMSNGGGGVDFMAGMQGQQPMQQQARLQPIQQQQSMRIPSGSQQRLNSVVSPVNLGIFTSLGLILYSIIMDDYIKEDLQRRVAANTPSCRTSV